jgi:hypothetical protein
MNYEVVPDSNLQRNIHVRTKLDDPIEMEAAQYVLSRVGEDQLKMIYNLRDYMALCNNGYFTEVCRTRSIYSASPPSFKTKLNQLMREGMRIGKSMIKSHAGDIGGAIGALAGPEFAPVGAEIGSGLGRYLAAPPEGYPRRITGESSVWHCSEPKEKEEETEAPVFHCSPPKNKEKEEVVYKCSPPQIQGDPKNHLQSWMTGAKTTLSAGVYKSFFPAVKDQSSDPDDVKIFTVTCSRAKPQGFESAFQLYDEKGAWSVSVSKVWRDSEAEDQIFWAGLARYLNRVKCLEGDWFLYVDRAAVLVGSSFQGSVFAVVNGISTKSAISGGIGWDQWNIRLTAIGDLDTKFAACIDQDRVLIISSENDMATVTDSVKFAATYHSKNIVIGTMINLASGMVSDAQYAGWVVSDVTQMFMAEYRLSAGRKSGKSLRPEVFVPPEEMSGKTDEEILDKIFEYNDKLDSVLDRAKNSDKPEITNLLKIANETARAAQEVKRKVDKGEIITPQQRYGAYKRMVNYIKVIDDQSRRLDSGFARAGGKKGKKLEKMEAERAKRIADFVAKRRAQQEAAGE